MAIRSEFPGWLSDIRSSSPCCYVLLPWTYMSGSEPGGERAKSDVSMENPFNVFASYWSRGSGSLFVSVVRYAVSVIFYIGFRGRHLQCSVENHSVVEPSGGLGEFTLCTRNR